MNLKIKILLSAIEFKNDNSAYVNIKEDNQIEEKKIELGITDGVNVEIKSGIEVGDKINNLPTQLSGGQQQRVAIARAISTEPSILLADEPTGALDQETGIKILELFKELNDEGRTIIMITHDKNIAKYGNRLLNIVDGNITESGEFYDKR